MKKIKIFGMLLVISLAVFWITYLNPTLKIATGYTAKYLCSYEYLSNIDTENAIEALNFFPIKYISYEINNKEKRIEASYLALLPNKPPPIMKRAICVDVCWVPPRLK